MQADRKKTRPVLDAFISCINVQITQNDVKYRHGKGIHLLFETVIGAGLRNFFHEQ
jgi:hypothetical protein